MKEKRYPPVSLLFVDVSFTAAGCLSPQNSLSFLSLCTICVLDASLISESDDNDARLFQSADYRKASKRIILFGI